ncbi:DUF6152 family protein [Azospirillum picis]|uniref:Uncharacterized protein n=1 Tax=Azospirillum picis TaxID=488438 RepID=A0ABU0MI70_9PROT|nr:DUF6152 family protein [Azospirillum picis]MBP2299210.1 hypothetical protein [Azospirillum picis]MDQ0533152.1 hypothetical protein [Azospirillum picis]
MADTADRIPIAHAGRRLAAATLAAVAVLAPAVPVLAHHGWGGYDTEKTLTLTGTVDQFAFRNPHAMLNLQSDGKLWHVVLAPPARMTARGLPEGSVQAGQTVTVVGYASKSDPTELRAERITAGGKTVELR